MPSTDFNGDGYSDIFWQNLSDGLVSNWLGSPTGGFVVNDAVALEYYLGDYGQLAAIGDFDGDGRSDTLWRYEDQVYVSYTSPGGAYDFASSAGHVALVEVTWQVLGAGDFDGDGLDDILWGSDDGRISNWLSNGDYEFTINDANAMTDDLAEWPVQAIGDFNEDGRDDLVVQFQGTHALVFSTPTGGWLYDDPFGQVSADWQIVGAGDFNGDGNDDILWRNTNGTISNWLFAGGLGFGTFAINDANALAAVSNDWQIVGIGDYNGDGRDDLLWRNVNNGAISDWLATPAGGWIVNDANALAIVATEWNVQPNLSGSGFWDY